MSTSPTSQTERAVSSQGRRAHSRQSVSLLAIAVGSLVVAALMIRPLTPSRQDLGSSEAESAQPSARGPVTAQSFGGLSWSPDGSALLAESADGLLVVSPGGDRLARIPGDVGAWLDSDTIAAWSSSYGDPSSGTVELYAVDGRLEKRFTGSFGSPVAADVSGGFALPESSASSPTYRLLVAGASMSGPRAGIPLAMTSQEIAVLLPSPSSGVGPGLVGSLSLDAVDGRRVRVFNSVFVSSAIRPRFSSDGRYLAVCASEEVDRECQLAVLDSTTGSVSLLGEPPSVFSWLPDDRLLFSSGSGPIGEWSAGSLSPLTLPSGSYVLASSRGDLVLWWPDGRPVVRILLGGREHDVQVSGDLVGTLAWSPDGESLAVVVWLPDKTHGQALTILAVAG